MTIGEWIKSARKHKGWSQEQLGECIGRTKANVGHWETGKHAPSLEQVAAISVATGYPAPPIGITTSKVHWSPGGNTPPMDALAALNDGLNKSEDKLIPAGEVGRGRLVPVVGNARLGDNGFYEEISSMAGAGDGLVDAYSSDPNAYALRVKGDSMFPAIRDGWYVVVEPNSAPQPGDYVLVKLKSGQKMVKELLMQRPDSITVSSVNGDVRKTIDMSEIDTHFGVQSVAAIVSPKKWRPE